MRGHLAQNCWQGKGSGAEAVGPTTTAEVLVATIRSSAVVIKGELGQVAVDMMLDSGLSVSLVWRDIVDKSQEFRQIAPREF